MLTVEPITFIKMPQGLEEPWRRLQAVSFKPNFQSDFDYVSAWLDTVRENWQALVLLVKAGSEVKGIFPLMFWAGRRRGVLPFRRVRFLASTYSDFNVVLADPQDIEEVAHAAFDWLFHGPFRWETLVLRDVVEGNPLVGVIESYFTRKSIDYQKRIGKYYYMDLKQPWEEVWDNTHKGIIRKNVGQDKRRLSKLGEWSMVSDPPWNTGELIEQATPMHVVRQSNLSRPSFFEDSRFIPFLTRVIDLTRSKQQFHSYWLMIRDQYIAYMLVFEQDGVLYFWNGAFHEDFSYYSPSKILQAEIIRDCHERGFPEFNFMRGEDEYKTNWTKTFRKNYSFEVRAHGLYGKLLDRAEKLVRRPR